MNRQWMPFYVADFCADTLHLTTEETGVYFLLICLTWLSSDASLPNDMAWLKRSLSRCATDMHGNRFNRLVPKILNEYFILTDGKWRQNRVTKEREKAKKLSEYQKENVEKRWSREREIKQLGDTVSIPTRPRQHNTYTKKEGNPFLKEEKNKQEKTLVQIDRDSPNGEAWEGYRRATEGKGWPWANGKWHFPSALPPAVSEPRNEVAA